MDLSALDFHSGTGSSCGSDCDTRMLIEAVCKLAHMPSSQTEEGTNKDPTYVLRLNHCGRGKYLAGKILLISGPGCLTHLILQAIKSKVHRSPLWLNPEHRLGAQQVVKTRTHSSQVWSQCKFSLQRHLQNHGFVPEWVSCWWRTVKNTGWKEITQPVPEHPKVWVNECLLTSAVGC